MGSMTQTKRKTPYPEWVLMYRSGIPVKRIAAVTRVAPSGIRFHLAKAAERTRDCLLLTAPRPHRFPSASPGPAMNFAFEKQK